MAIPRTNELFTPVLRALEHLGGEGANAEIEEHVVESLKLSQDDVSRLHNPAKGKRTELGYRLAWARTKLKDRALVERVGNQRWRLTDNALSD